MIQGTLTYLTVKDSGEFRKGDEGIFDEKGNCIFVCPPPVQITYLMKNLFNWMKTKKMKFIHEYYLQSFIMNLYLFIHLVMVMEKQHVLAKHNIIKLGRYI